MSESVIMELDEITLSDWTNWHWEDITEIGGEKRVYIRGAQRTPSEANQAYDEFKKYLTHRTDGLKRAQ